MVARAPGLSRNNDRSEAKSGVYAATGPIPGQAWAGVFHTVFFTRSGACGQLWRARFVAFPQPADNFA